MSSEGEGAAAAASAAAAVAEAMQEHAAAKQAAASAAAAAWDNDGDVNMDGPVYPSPAERAAAAAQRGLEAKRRAARASVAVAHGLSESDDWHSL